MDTNHAQVTGKPIRKLGPGDDLEMINSPHLWPWKDRLPVINRTKVCPFVGGMGMPGVIFKDNPTTVHVGLIFLGLTGERFCYSSVAELLQEGWRID